MSILLRINGEEQAIKAECVAALLNEIGIDAARPGIAVALNGGLVRRAEWGSQAVCAGDEIEIIRPVTGG